jgi:hypothetical protein
MCKWKCKRFLTSLVANGRLSWLISVSRVSQTCSQDQVVLYFCPAGKRMAVDMCYPKFQVRSSKLHCHFSSSHSALQFMDKTLLASWYYCINRKLRKLSSKLFNTGDCCSAHGYQQRELLSYHFHAMLLLHLHCWITIASSDQPQNINTWDFSSMAIM